MKDRSGDNAATPAGILPMRHGVGAATPLPSWTRAC